MTPRRALREPLVRAASASAALDQLEARGGSRRAALDRAGLSEASLADELAMIPVARCAALYAACAAQLDDRAFALMLGAAAPSAMLGDLAYVAMNAPTVLSAIERMVRFASAQTVGVEVSFERVGPHGRLRYGGFDAGDPEASALDVEAGASAAVSLLRSMIDASWAPRAVRFAHRAPRDVSAFERYFGSPIQFRSARNEIEIDRASLASTVRGADPRLLCIVERHLHAAVASVAASRDPFASAVHDAVARQLPSGAAELDRVARSLSLSARTLQRRLTERGMPFRTVVDDVRRELALRYIRESTMSLTELSLLLGFSELSAFSRAFRRWTGTSPQRHERSLR